MILNGLIRITSPAPETEVNSSMSLASPLGNISPAASVAYIMPGTVASTLLIAADMKSSSYARGHYTEFPSDEPTILIQIPFVNNLAPEHAVLHDGACT
jgi:hypothetical protein